MPESFDREDYFKSSQSWLNLIESLQEEATSVPKTDTISIKDLAAQYPYLVILPKGNTAPKYDFSKWQKIVDFNNFFPVEEKQPQKYTLSIREISPEKDSLFIQETPESDTLFVAEMYLDSDTLLKIDTLFIKEAHPEEKIHLKQEIYPGKEGKPIHQGIQTETWFTPLLFLMFVAYGLTFFRKKKILLQDVKEFFSFSFGNDTFKKDFSLDNFQSRALLFIAGIVNISLFSFFAITRFLKCDVENFTLTLLLLFTLTVLYVLFKIAAIKLICYIFFDKNYSSIWTKTFYSSIRFMGIILIPIVLYISFGPAIGITSVVYIGLSLCICILILYISKITAFFFQNASSLFYLILYLCSLEILPALIFLKELINVITMV